MKESWNITWNSTSRTAPNQVQSHPPKNKQAPFPLPPFPYSPSSTPPFPGTLQTPPAHFENGFPLPASTSLFIYSLIFPHPSFLLNIISSIVSKTPGYLPPNNAPTSPLTSSTTPSSKASANILRVISFNFFPVSSSNPYPPSAPPTQHPPTHATKEGEHTLTTLPKSTTISTQPPSSPFGSTCPTGISGNSRLTASIIAE